MKIERLLQIVIYLLNRNRVTGIQLATKFEVSLRTIQRDIDTLTLAGFPIIAYVGLDGGYEMDPDYKLHLQVANSEDYKNILQSLYAYQSAFQSDEELDQTIEKIQSLKHETDEFYISIDYSIASELPEVNKRLELLMSAIQKKSCVSFYYVNSKGEESIKYVQPFSVVFKWYAWYLHGFDTIKNERRMYKLIRMDELFYNDTPYIPQRALIPLETSITEMYHITMYVSSKAKNKCIEYLGASIIEQLEEDLWLMETKLAVDEMFWKGIVIALGKEVQIIKPLALKRELKKLIEEFYFSNYDKHLS